MINPIVFVHGLPDHSGTWEKVLPILEKYTHRITKVGLPGINDNKVLNNYSSINDLANLLKEHLNPKTIYIGHDFGAILGTVIAANFPNLISNLILINGPTPYILFKAINDNIDQASKSQYAKKLASQPTMVIPKNDFKFLKYFLFSNLNSPSPTYKDSLLKLWSVPQVQQNIGTYYRSMLNYKADKIDFHQPTTQIWSKNDKFLGPHVQLKMATTFPLHKTIYLQNESHWPQLSSPETLSKIIIKVLDDI